MAEIDDNLISFQSTKVTSLENNKYLQKWVSYFDWETIKSELLILQKKSLSKHEILKYLTNPTRLEFLTAIAIKHKLPQVKVIPNYPCDDEGIPTSTAGGQSNQGDIECFEDDKGTLVEVTMSEGRTQTMMEVWPITRHLKEFSKKSKSSMCFLIAPSIFEDSQRQIKFVKQEEGALIVAKTISSFIEYLEMSNSLHSKEC